MSLNIGEANAANVVLKALLDPTYNGPRDISDDLVAAAMLLAASANKTLGAGLTPAIVEGMLA